MTGSQFVYIVLEEIFGPSRVVFTPHFFKSVPPLIKVFGDGNGGVENHYRINSTMWGLRLKTRFKTYSVRV